jgi:cysteate synthase
MGRYKLHCPSCKITFEDVFNNFCPSCGNSGPLISAIYKQTDFNPLPMDSFWKFQSWLPCEGWNDMIRSRTIVFKSNGFAKELGLKNLYIAYNGYWPERSANMVTCTFKELESPTTFQRAVEKCITNFVIASAGNTARAFIWAAQFYESVDLFVVVPRKNMNKLVIPFELPKNVTVIAVNHNSDYTDSIMFAGRMANDLKLVPEGGTRNIARRDGMGTVFLEAVNTIGQIPQHSFQAVGSGTGAIGTFEAAQRLLGSGKFTGALPKLHLAQNIPFTPLTDSWTQRSKELIRLPEEQQRKAVEQVYADVLTNRNPPYSVGGGVYDILSATDGKMYGITNEEAKSVGKLFEDSEEIDLVPAAFITVGALAQAVETNQIDSDDLILVNITGGGDDRLWEDFEKIKIEPDIICDDTAHMNELKVVLEAGLERQD